MADRFYVNCPLTPGPITVEGPEAHHLATVSRLRPGDRVYLFNGDGHEYPTRVEQLARQRVTLQILAVKSPHRELGYRLEVAAPLPKGDRAQFLVEKLTELGATTYVPLRTERSVVHPRDSRREKLQRCVVEASKQCGRNVLLHIEALVDWQAYCTREGLPPARVVAHPGGTMLRSLAGQDLAVAVGPEGGFTDKEIEQALKQGWQVVGLGPRTLRIETAALVLAACAVYSPPANSCQ
jgi:16S rRNA (uracil1498-N3)-methyltransferase